MQGSPIGPSDSRTTAALPAGQREMQANAHIRGRL